MELTSFETVSETASYRIFWHDEPRTVCVIQGLVKQWTWEQALVAVQAIDATARSVPHGVYVVYLFELGKNMMPHGGGAIPNLRRLMSYYAPNTLMVLFVRPDPALRVFADIVTKTFKLLGRNYHFLTSIEDCLKLIQQHRETEARG